MKFLNNSISLDLDSLADNLQALSIDDNAPSLMPFLSGTDLMKGLEKIIGGHHITDLKLITSISKLKSFYPAGGFSQPHSSLDEHQNPRVSFSFGLEISSLDLPPTLALVSYSYHLRDGNSHLTFPVSLILIKRDSAWNVADRESEALRFWL